MCGRLPTTFCRQRVDVNGALPFTYHCEINKNVRAFPGFLSGVVSKGYVDGGIVLNAIVEWKAELNTNSPWQRGTAPYQEFKFSQSNQHLFSSSGTKFLKDTFQLHKTNDM